MYKIDIQTRFENIGRSEMIRTFYERNISQPKKYNNQ